MRTMWKTRKPRRSKFSKRAKSMKGGSFGWRNSVRLNSLSLLSLAHLILSNIRHLSRASEFTFARFWGTKFSPCSALLSVSQLKLTCVTIRFDSVKHPPDYCGHCHHLCKVLGDKVLPLFCILAILAYWTLGLTLPSPVNILNVSTCTSPLWGSFDQSSFVLTSSRFANKSFFIHPGLLDSQPQVQRKLNP